jgi:hypothetical protein
MPQQNQHEPSESDAGVHITQKWVFLPHLSVYQAFHKYFMDGGKDFFAEKAFSQSFSVLRFELSQDSDYPKEKID